VIAFGLAMCGRIAAKSPKVSEKPPLLASDVGRLLGLLVHDLRNPAATIAANSDFLKDIEIPDEDGQEALADVQIALDELRRGLELVAWVGRWLCGQPAVGESEADVGQAMEVLCRSIVDDKGSPRLELDRSGSLRARGGGAAGPILRALIDNARAHARNGPITLRVRREGDEVVVEMEDTGRALAPELREAAFTLAGQQQLKGRGDGRYGRFASLLACGAAAESIGGRIEPAGEDGRAIFRLRLPAGA
jgi:signal transduction histidine kinase